MMLRICPTRREPGKGRKNKRIRVTFAKGRHFMEETKRTEEAVAFVWERRAGESRKVWKETSLTHRAPIGIWRGAP